MGEKIQQEILERPGMAIAITILIALLGYIAVNIRDNNKMMFDFMEKNNVQHTLIRDQLQAQTSHLRELEIYYIHPTDTLSKVNSRRLDLQSDYSYNQVHKFDSIVSNHEHRIIILENKVK